MPEATPVRVVFHNAAEYMIETENIEMTDDDVEAYLRFVCDGELADSISRVTLFSKTHGFRRICVDLQ